MNLKHFIKELKRRNVFKVAGVYAVAGWVLIQVAATTFPFFNIPNWGVRFVVGLVILGFPISIILAWAFELTPDGVKRTDEVPKEQSITQATGKKLNHTVIAVLALAVVVLSYKLFFSGKTSVATNKQVERQHIDSLSVPAKSIAVLPFENLSEDKKNGYFADGMQDLILTKLADIGDLKVISRTSTLQFGSHPQNLKEIGRELGVATLLEGSVQKAGDQVLINVQLIDARTDQHLWAHSYQRVLENIFGVEGEVAETIASSLKAKLDPAEQARVTSVPTHNPAAYDAYLRGVSLETNASDLSGINLEEVASHYEQAVKLDPDFALAWAHLSSVNSSISFSEINSQRLARAKTALERAVTLAPDAAATEIARGNYAYYGHFEYAKALAAYRKALQISPNSTTALVNIGFVLRRQGHWQQAIDYMKRSLVLDPRNINTLSNLAWSNESLMRYEKAEVLLRRALAISPGDQTIITQLAGLYQMKGNLAKAGKVLANARISPIYWETSYQTVIRQALLTHQYEDAIHLAKVALTTPHLTKLAVAVNYRRLGFAEQLTGDRKSAHNAYAQTVAIMKQMLPSANVKLPRFAPMIDLLAFAQAGLGEKDKALASARRAVALQSTSRDAFQGPVSVLRLAMTEAQVGDKTQAIATLKRLLMMPPGSAVTCYITPALLHLDPIWNPLRKDPAFQALIKKYPWKQE